MIDRQTYAFNGAGGRVKGREVPFSESFAPAQVRGRGPLAASYREAMTKMTMGGSGDRRSEDSEKGNSGPAAADSPAASGMGAAGFFLA